MTRTLLRRGASAGVAAAAAVALAAGPAAAHHCFVPMYSLNGPSSPHWFVVSAEMGAGFDGYVTGCDAAREAGYAALQDAGLPVGIKIFVKMTIGDPQLTGRLNPNGADGRGLEYFMAGSGLPDQIVGTYVSAADAVACD